MQYILGYFGGLLSLFLGASVLTVFECFDIIFTSLICTANRFQGTRSADYTPPVRMNKNGHGTSGALLPPTITVSSDSEDNQTTFNYHDTALDHVTKERGTRC